MLTLRRPYSIVRNSLISKINTTFGPYVNVQRTYNHL